MTPWKLEMKTASEGESCHNCDSQTKFIGSRHIYDLYI